jgi:hypothetical protein
MKSFAISTLPVSTDFDSSPPLTDAHSLIFHLVLFLEIIQQVFKLKAPVVSLGRKIQRVGRMLLFRHEEIGKIRNPDFSITEK